MERHSFLPYLWSTVTKVGDALSCMYYLLFTPLHRKVLNKLPHRFGLCWQPAKTDLPANMWFSFTYLFNCSKSTFFRVKKELCHPFVYAIIYCWAHMRTLRLWVCGRGARLRKRWSGFLLNRFANARQLSWCLLYHQGGTKWSFDRWTEIWSWTRWQFLLIFRYQPCAPFVAPFSQVSPHMAKKLPSTLQRLPIFPQLVHSSPPHDSTFTAAAAIATTHCSWCSGKWLNPWWSLTEFLSFSAIHFPCFWALYYNMPCNVASPSQIWMGSAIFMDIKRQTAVNCCKYWAINWLCMLVCKSTIWNAAELGS